MYDPVPPATRAARMSLMAARQCLPHLDPAHKLAFGWVTPKPVVSSGFYAIDDVKVGRTVRILPRYDSGALQEYFILENRQDSDQASPLYDTAINESGIAVWHIVENPIENAKVPRGVSMAVWNGVPQTQVRRGIRLLRPWEFVTDGGAVVEDDADLWSSEDYTLVSAPCPGLFLPPGVLVPSKNTLSWADCSPSGYEVRFLDLPAPSMTINVQLK